MVLCFLGGDGSELVVCILWLNQDAGVVSWDGRMYTLIRNKREPYVWCVQYFPDNTRAIQV